MKVKSRQEILQEAMKRRIYLSDELAEYYKEQRAYASRGRTLATAAVNALDAIIERASTNLDAVKNRFDYNNLQNDEVSRSIKDQLAIIKEDYELMPDRLRVEINSRSKSVFTITLFGRTMAGKSTLAEILTQGDGSSIGDGRQAFTREAKEYRDHNIKIVDVPGVAAFDGKEDEDIAFTEAIKGDLIIIVINDEDIQSSVAKCIFRIIEMGKPVICLVNVRVGIDDKEELTPTKMKVFKYDLKQKMSKDHISGIKETVYQYGESHGQKWGRIRFETVHLKAAYLSQQERFAPYRAELYDLSNFEKVTRLIKEEIAENGGFYKLKAYTEIVTVELMNFVDTLYRQSAQNNKNGLVFQSKKDSLSKWISDFISSAEIEINNFTIKIADELRAEAAIFAEDNYSNRDADKAWNELVESKIISVKAEEEFRHLLRECEIELSELYRETEFDLKYGYTFSAAGALKVAKVIDGKRIWSWSTRGVSGVLSIAGIVFMPTLVPFGIAVGIIGEIGSLFFKDYNKKAQKARDNLREKLLEHISKMERQLKKSLLEAVHNSLVRDYMRPAERTLSDMESSLKLLSNIQYDLACELNGKLQDVNRTLITEALAYKGFNGRESLVKSIARIPGYAIMLLLEDGAKFPEDAKAALKVLIKHENIWFIFQKNSPKPIIRQALGKGFERVNIYIDKIDGKPRIAHLPVLENANVDTLNRIKMAQQLTELLILD